MVSRVIPNIPFRDLHRFIVNDFEGAWAGIVATAPNGRGNMMFARQAMLLIELAARSCAGRRSRLQQLSQALRAIEPRYFSPLPGPCGRNQEFELPYDPNRGAKEAQLLWALFDMIRNGGAHQYQQIVVRLTDKRRFAIRVSGADLPLGAPRRPRAHLGYLRDHYGHVLLHVSSGTMFLDFRDAVTATGLLNRRRVGFRYLERPSQPRSKPLPPAPRFYDFTSRALREALDAAGHQRL